MKHRGITAIMLASALIVAPLTASVASAAPASPALAVHVKAAAKTFKNCAQLNKKYKGGVAKKGVKGNKVSGKLQAFKTRPTFNTALYKANIKLDRDKDGIACEK